jgi:hypothetical protein
MTTHDAEQGQVLVIAAAFMALVFLPLAVLVIDGGLVESAYAQLGETLQASAEDGASMIDVDVLRRGDGQQVVLNPDVARTTCERSIRASGMPGIVSTTVTVRGDTVTASATIRVDLLIVGAVAITETRSAGFRYGA